MADPKPETTDAAADPATEQPVTEAPPAAPKGRSGVLPPNPSQKDSDRVARPGFRNPPNKNSKAMKNKKKK